MKFHRDSHPTKPTHGRPIPLADLGVAFYWNTTWDWSIEQSQKLKTQESRFGNTVSTVTTWVRIPLDRRTDGQELDQRPDVVDFWDIQGHADSCCSADGLGAKAELLCNGRVHPWEVGTCWRRWIIRKKKKVQGKGFGDQPGARIWVGWWGTTYVKCISAKQILYMNYRLL